MKNLQFIIVCFITITTYSQKTFTAKNGVTYEKGSVLYATKPYQGSEYTSIFQMGSFNVKFLGTEINGKKLVVRKITQNKLYNKEGDYTYLKCDLEDGSRCTVLIQSAIDACEIRNCELPQLKREVSGNSDPFSFQGSTWGDNMEMLRGRNGEPIDDKNETLSYSTSVNGLEGYLFYYFQNDKLYQIGYSFQEKHSEDQLYVEDFLGLNKLLEQKYGESEMEYDWRNTLYKGDYRDIGRAIAAGHLRIINKWSLRDTDIRHGLNGDNFDVSHILLYSKYPKEKIDKKKELNKL